MKNYTITVNGNVYDVTVEEGTSTGAVASTPVATPKKVVAPKAAANTTTAGAQGNVKVNAPMQGKILSIKASVGQSVKKGEVLMILEAMKMENEIVAPENGTIASINVASGDKVESGAVLATLN
ncbi:MAG: biotin/lipoyl-binding protein [Lachnospiraceae bacterium]|nr:biotin/lipoyl-binding protein [Lachnospiraceae bacterium]